jgi:enoyl-CoA hydratase/carnithine racemase
MLSVTDAEGVARVTLDRPEKRNALSLELMDELTGVLRRLGARPDARAIVVEGAGVAFSAGHDLSEMVGRDLPLLPAPVR